MNPTILHFNGINGATGKPLLPAQSAQQLLNLIQGADDREGDQAKAANKTTYEARIANREVGVRGVVKGVDACDLTSAKWGVIFHPDTPQAVRDTLLPLINARQGQIILYDPAKDGNDALAFRARFGQGPGEVNPKYLPYYLLIVASPAQISYKFQYSLDAQHAVGRLYFETPDEYESYVTRLLAYEAAPTRQRRAIFFAPQNDADRATFLSANFLAKPLVKALKESNVVKQAYEFEFITAQAAKRDTLLDALTRSTQPPALVFTATHGLGYAKDHALQAANQGALLCGEWTEPVDTTPATAIPTDAVLSGSQITTAHNCDGLIVFAFGCYTAGTPQLDDFSQLAGQAPQVLASQPRVACLPQRLLAQGALAFIGHVDQVWDYSFIFQGVGQSLDTFQSGLEGILSGEPIGYAFEAFNQRWLDLSQAVTQSNEASLLAKYLKGYPIEADRLVYYWTAHNDARAYVIFGDPFVRLQPDRLSAA